MYHHQKFHEQAAEDRGRRVDHFTLISEGQDRARDRGLGILLLVITKLCLVGPVS